MPRLIDRVGMLSIEPAENPFRRRCVSILNQQLSAASAAAIRERAVDVVGSVPPAGVLAADPDDDAAIAEVTKIHGVGTWTAQLSLVGALGRENVLPPGNFAVRRGSRRCTPTATVCAVPRCERSPTRDGRIRATARDMCGWRTSPDTRARGGATEWVLSTARSLLL
ncbi:MAG: hypothetical protein PPP55_01650 [Halorubrum sp.]